MNYLKGTLAGNSFFSQLIVLVVLVVAGTVVASLISAVIVLTAGVDTAKILAGESYLSDLSPNALRFIQTISVVCMFLLPALAAAYLFSFRLPDYLSAGKLPGGRALVLTAVSVVFFAPFNSVVTVLNMQMELPASLAPLEEWMRQQEESAEYMIRQLTAGEGLGNLLSNIYVIAVVAGVTEEFFFRGALERILGKALRNHHVVIWITAIIFSAVHLQFFGFLPRLLVGAYLGYLLYWSKTIWLPVFAHIFNNTCAIFQMRYPALLGGNESPTHRFTQEDIVLAIGGLALFVVCLYFLKKSFRPKAVATSVAAPVNVPPGG